MGCGPSKEELAAQTATSKTATFEAIPTDTPTLTPVPSTSTPTPTSTHTPTPIPPTATSTATSTPSPTPIPPTSTPISTPTVGDTVIGSRWKIKVTKVETADEFGTYYFKEDSANHFVIVTLEATYLGSETREWFPESVLLAHTGNDGFTGWVRIPNLYKGMFSSQITDFSEMVTVNFAQPETVLKETFLFEFPKDYTDFRLYFPETEAIAISLE